MQALLLQGKEHVELANIPRPTCSPRGAMLRVRACGVCGGDVRTYFHGFGVIETDNQIMGHEITGEVVEVGAQHRQHRIGDRLALAAELHCHQCYFCKQEQYSLCENLQILGKHVTGGFAEYFHLTEEVINHGVVHYIPDDVSYIDAALSEPLCSVLECQERLAIGEATSVLVIGGGPMGCLHAEIAKQRGAHPVILSGTNQARLDVARKILAIERCVHPREEDLGRIIGELTDGLGVHRVIVAAPSATAVEEAFRYVRKYGKVDIFGGLPKDQSVIRVDANLLHYGNIELIGDFSYHPSKHAQALQLIASGGIDPRRFITVLPMSQFDQAIHGMKHGSYLKVILDMEG